MIEVRMECPCGGGEVVFSVEPTEAYRVVEIVEVDHEGCTATEDDIEAVMDEAVALELEGRAEWARFGYEEP